MPNYIPLTYMTYNAPHWYAAMVTATMCVLMYSIFVNVIQFEAVNRLGICHPYFYQSDACRKLIADTVARNPDFLDIGTKYKRTMQQSSPISALKRKIEEEDAATQLGKLSDNLQSLGTTYLGKLQNVVSAPQSGGKPSFASQLKTLLDQTLVDPTRAKYIDPLTRLYKTLFP